MDLVRTGRVELLAIALPGIWRYESQTDDFIAIDGDEFFYDINRVPSDVRALAAATTGVPDITWGVVMDAGLRAELDALMATIDGGEIIVNSNGRLSHRP